MQVHTEILKHSLCNPESCKDCWSKPNTKGQCSLNSPLVNPTLIKHRSWSLNHFSLKCMKISFHMKIKEAVFFFRFQAYTIHLSENSLTHGSCGYRRQSPWAANQSPMRRPSPTAASATGWSAPVPAPSLSRQVCHLSTGSGVRYQVDACESVINVLSSLF